MRKEIWIIVGLIVLIALSASFYIVTRKPALTLQGIEGGQNTTAKIDQKTIAKDDVKTPDSGITVNSFIQDAGTPKSQEFKPFFVDEAQKIEDTFLEKFSALVDKQSLTQVDSGSNSNLTDQTVPEVLVSATGTAKHILTDEEWFEIAYPDFYIRYLVDMEELMQEMGFLNGSEKYDFTSEKNINSFIHKFIDFGLTEGFLSEEQVKKARYGIDVALPALQKKERARFEGRTDISAFWSQMLAYLKTAIAYASDHTSPDCYRDGDDGSQGSNEWVFCCNCGTGIIGKKYEYCDDCGSASCLSSCNIKKMGCLNSTCQSSKPAIWDPESFTCGCGG